MRFFPHGQISPAAQAALIRHGHAICAAGRLTAAPTAALTADGPVSDVPPSENAAVPDHPRDLLSLLHARQCHLLTTDTQLIRQIYEGKIEFPNGLIVHLLDDPAVLADQSAAIDRLFARYPRLTAKRLYTLTASRVKIRQLPGCG